MVIKVHHTAFIKTIEWNLYYYKSSIKLPGAFSFQECLMEELNREGGLLERGRVI